MIKKQANHMPRTYKKLTEMGLRHATVETWNAFARNGQGCRQDLFGFIDILALDPERGFIGIQVCGTDVSGHVSKIKHQRWKNCLAWLNAGGTVEIWSWVKKSNRYQLKIRPITKADAPVVKAERVMQSTISIAIAEAEESDFEVF